MPNPATSHAPVDSTVEALAKLHAKEALSVQVEIMRDPDVKPEIRLKAADSVLDRGVGRPSRAVVYVPAKQRTAAQLASMSDEQLLALAAQARAQQAQAAEQEASEMRAAAAEAASMDPSNPLYRSRDGRRLLPFSLTDDEIIDVPAVSEVPDGPEDDDFDPLA